MLVLVLCIGPVHPESIHRASLVPHFVMLQPYSTMDSAHFHLKFPIMTKQKKKKIKIYNMYLSIHSLCCDTQK